MHPGGRSFTARQPVRKRQGRRLDDVNLYYGRLTPDLALASRMRLAIRGLFGCYWRACYERADTGADTLFRWQGEGPVHG